jgi:hypothetical protein
MALQARPLHVGKARVTFCSVKCFVWVSGQRAFGVLWVSGLSDCGVRGLFGFCGFFFLLFCLGFFLLVLVRCFLCILSVYLGTLNAFYKISITYKKK